MIRLPRNTRDPIRLGIMGPGAVAQSVYLPLLARIPERYVVSAVADLSASTLEAVAARHGVPEQARFGRPDAMIDAGGLDAVVVLTGGSHVEYMKQYDPAVTEAARVVRERTADLGALRAVEVTVLHPSSGSQ